MPHDLIVEDHNKKFENIDKKFEQIDDRLNKGLERIVKVEESSKSAHHRLREQGDQVKAIYEMSSSIRVMSEQVKEAIDILKDHDERLFALEIKPNEHVTPAVIEKIDQRLDALERKPGEQILKYWQLFVGALITGGAGVLIGVLINLNKG